MLLSKLATYILSGKGKIFRPESGCSPTPCSAPRVMTSWSSHGGSRNNFDVKKKIWNVKTVDNPLLWAIIRKQRQPIIDFLFILWEYPHTILIEGNVPDKAWICILVLFSLKFCRAWNLRCCFDCIQHTKSPWFVLIFPNCLGLHHCASPDQELCFSLSVT